MNISFVLNFITVLLYGKFLRLHPVYLYFMKLLSIFLQFDSIKKLCSYVNFFSSLHKILKFNFLIFQSLLIKISVVLWLKMGWFWRAVCPGFFSIWFLNYVLALIFQRKKDTKKCKANRYTDIHNQITFKKGIRLRCSEIILFCWILFEKVGEREEYFLRLVTTVAQKNIFIK